MSISSISSISGSSLAYSLATRISKMSGQPPDPAEIISRIMEEEDKDGDGVISATESRLDSKRFGEIDTDGDGVLTTEELQSSFEKRQAEMGGMPRIAGMPGGPPPDPAEMAARILEEEDTNGDGLISADEARIDSERFGEIDSDGDGLLTAEELQANFESRQAEMARRMLQQGFPSQQDGDNGLQSLAQALAQNEGAGTYGAQSWLYDMLQSAAQNLGVTA